MSAAFHFDPVTMPPECEALRPEVRGFLAEARASGLWRPARDFATSFSAEFSREVGRRGWIGLTWPKPKAPVSALAVFGQSCPRTVF